MAGLRWSKQARFRFSSATGSSDVGVENREKLIELRDELESKRMKE